MLVHELAAVEYLPCGISAADGEQRKIVVTAADNLVTVIADLATEIVAGSPLSAQDAVDPSGSSKPTQATEVAADGVDYFFALFAGTGLVETLSEFIYNQDNMRDAAGIHCVVLINICASAGTEERKALIQFV